MAKPTTTKGSKVGVFLEDQDNPGNYIKPCGLESVSLSFTKGLNEVEVPDCDDPDLPAWLDRSGQSLSASVSGDGILADEALQKWWAFFNSADSYNVRIYKGDLTDTTSGWYWEGKLQCANFEVTGGRSEVLAKVSIQTESDGEFTLVKIT